MQRILPNKKGKVFNEKKVENNSKTIDGPPYLVHGAPEDVWRAVEFVPGLRLEAGPAMKKKKGKYTYINFPANCVGIDILLGRRR